MLLASCHSLCKWSLKNYQQSCSGLEIFSNSAGEKDVEEIIKQTGCKWYSKLIWKSVAEVSNSILGP